MARNIGLGLAAAALTVLVAPQAWADVIPSRRAAKSADAGRVKDCLAQAGAPAAEAQRQVESLTTEEAAYFASGSGRVQVVSGLYLEEWLLAAGFVLLVGGITLLVIDDTQK